MKLTEFPKIKYSMLEYYLFKQLPENGSKIGSKQIAKARQKRGNWKVDNPENVVTVVMNNLIRKVKANREDFVIEKDGRRPGHPEVEYWLRERDLK